MDDRATIAVVIPCYRVIGQILDVLVHVGPEVSAIYCVDDACPDGSGDWIAQNCRDPRVKVLRNPENQGVGGAVITGYRQALADGVEIVVKVDGDGQMDPGLIPTFVAPILAGEADYTKGNRFFDPERLGAMPAIRVFGNAVLSFVTKVSSGYWHIFDPTNGYTAVHAEVLGLLPLEKVDRRYFFESDLLFRLNTVRAVVVDVPMQAVYADETSNLSVRKVLLPFMRGHLRNVWKRLVYNYFLRDFQLASIELVLGVLLLGFGIPFGLYHWLLGALDGHPATAGTVMLAALPMVIGVQLLLAAVNFDIQAVPRMPVHPHLVRRRRLRVENRAVEGVERRRTASR